MALPASEPANHTFMMASTCACSQVRTVARPEKFNSTTGLPSATRASSSSRCTSGISNVARLLLSPENSALSPIAHTITSASLATASASAFALASSTLGICLPNSAASCKAASRVRLQPWAYNSCALPFSACSIPSFIV